MNLENHIETIQDFPIPGVAFKDIGPLLRDHQAFSYMIDKLHEETEPMSYTTIGAYDARGFLLAAPLAVRAEKPFFMFRKAGKLPGQTVQETYGLEYATAELEMQQNAVNSSDRVLLLDDVLATGGTMRAGANLVERVGASVAGTATLIELLDLNGREAISEYNNLSLIQYGGAK